MNSTNTQQVKEQFRGSFIAAPELILERLLKAKAYVFDWDGVFNNGFKDAGGSSPFNEVDSMGINMLRFHHRLRTGQNPIVAVISGEKNEAAFTLAKREHFQHVYSRIRHKADALLHLCAAHNIEPHEVVFFFDDVLDLSIAEMCGLRIMAGKACYPMFTNLVREKKLADYITANDGGNNAIREAVELLMGLTGRYDDTIMQRVAWSGNYHDYITERNTIDTTFFTLQGSEITTQLL